MTDRLFTKRAIGVSIDCPIRGSIPELTALACLGRQSQVFARMINSHLGQVQNSLWRIVGHTYKSSSYWSAPGGQGFGLLIYFKIPIRLMPEPGNTILKLLDFRFVFFRRQLNEGCRHPYSFRLLARTSAFRNMIESIHHTIVVLCSNGVILVIMTLGTGHGQAQPGGGGDIHPVKKNHKALLFRNRSTLPIIQMISVKPAGYLLINRGMRKKISRELPNGKLIKWHVLIEGLHHPVPPDPLIGFSIKLKTIAIGIAGGIQPFHSHSLSVMRASQQMIDHFFIRIRGGIVHVSIHFFRRGRQPDQVGIEAFDQNLFFCLRTGFKVSTLKL